MAVHSADSLPHGKILSIFAAACQIWQSPVTLFPTTFTTLVFSVSCSNFNSRTADSFSYKLFQRQYEVGHLEHVHTHFSTEKVECFHSICNFTGSHAFKVVHKCKTERNISVLFTVLHPFRRITWFHLDRLRTKNEASSDRVRKVNKTRIRRFCALTCNFTR